MNTVELALRLKQIEDCQDSDEQRQQIEALNNELIPDGLLLIVEEDQRFSVRIVDWKC